MAEPKKVRPPGHTDSNDSVWRRFKDALTDPKIGQTPYVVLDKHGLVVLDKAEYDALLARALPLLGLTSTADVSDAPLDLVET